MFIFKILIKVINILKIKKSGRSRSEKIILSKRPGQFIIVFKIDCVSPDLMASFSITFLT